MQNLLPCVLMLTAQIAFAQYPLLPQDQQHYINGTVGEERQGVYFRHDGGVGRLTATANYFGTLETSIRAISATPGTQVVIGGFPGTSNTTGNVRFGFMLEQKQYAAAGALLQAFPLSTADDQYFVQVQSVNVARLSDPEFTLSKAQETALLSIAEAPSPEAGYAQTLLGILTGRTFMPKLPDLDTGRSAEPVKAVASSGLEISPNPVNDLLRVRLQPSAIQQTLELRVLATGALVQSVDVSGQESLTLPVRHLPSGLYVLVLREQGGIVARQKVAVQH